ncbi:MAG: methionine synthase [Phycisphaerales bacterium]
MSSRFIEALERRVLCLDGAMGTTTHELGLDLETDYLGKENCTEVLVQTRPDAVEEIHRRFLLAGADGVETNTFGANPLVLAEFEMEDQAREVNRLAAEIARAACDSVATPDRPRFVIGSIGPGTKLITLGHVDWETLHASYLEQVRGLLEGGTDVLLLETSQDILQVKCAINACLDGLKERGLGPEDVPIMVQVTIETTGTMLVGTDIAAAAAVVKDFPVLSLGLNCATGPLEMSEHVNWLARHWDRHISVLPNAGLPSLVEGRTEYPLGPAPFVEKMIDFVETCGLSIVGGCCGTTIEHIRQLSEALDGRPRAERTVMPFAPACTSLYGPTDYRQDNSLLNVGERTNASGSRKFKRLLEAEDWDEIVSLAREMVREGSHVIDVNVDYAGRDNAADMAEVVRRIVRQVNVPLMLDSTQPATIEAGLKAAGGKCIINSANLEEGEEKFAEMCQLARRYGAGLVLGTIDEDPEEAMARTAERKLSIAERMHDLATQTHGLDAADLFFDPLVLPVSTGMEKDRRSALETIEGTRRISERFPACQITCGLSNVSFGLSPAARQVLNSVFLHELTEAGMTGAILHVSKILPRTRIDDAAWDAAMDLLYDRRPDAPQELADGTLTDDPLQIFIDLFPTGQKSLTTKEDLADLPLEERLRRHIIDGEKKGVDVTLEEAMQQYPPLAIINDHLLDGMKTVGELFASGAMQLPFVLQSAEVMKMAVAQLEPHMEKADGQTKGSIVLATVKGDVHDIGKNLVDIILTNNGYTVHNIGIKQPVGSIIQALRETGADAIGLSGLLVKSVTVMEENLQEFNTQSIDVPILLGGAALARHYCENHLRPQYKGPLFYGKDAFDGLRIMDHLAAGDLTTLNDEIVERREKRDAATAKVAALREREAAAAAAASSAAGEIASGGSESGGGAATLVKPAAGPHGPGCGCGTTAAAAAGGGADNGPVRSPATTDEALPEPPFWGDRVVESVPLDQIYPFINPVALYRGQWQLKKGRMSAAEYERFIEDTAEPVFKELAARCRDEEILQPKVVYGWYPCVAEAEDLVILDPKDHGRELERFSFPRQRTRQRWCISDFFRPAESGEVDVVGMSCVTVGSRASEGAKELFESDRYQEYLYLHGFSVETAEGLAELWHKRMRAELGIGNDDSPEIKKLFTQHYRGSRFSFGYPACPEMSDQEKLFRLLRPERIGCELTENWQIDPEQSTSAIIVHHRQAKYFSL